MRPGLTEITPNNILFHYTSKIKSFQHSLHKNSILVTLRTSASKGFSVHTPNFSSQLSQVSTKSPNNSFAISSFSFNIISFISLNLTVLTYEEYLTYTSFLRIIFNLFLEAITLLVSHPATLKIRKKYETCKLYYVFLCVRIKKEELSLTPLFHPTNMKN